MANRHHYARVGRSRLPKDVDDWIDDEFEDDERDGSSDYDPNRFDQKLINRALAKLAPGSYEEALDEIHNPSADRNQVVIVPGRSRAIIRCDSGPRLAT
jgi:hypothetical protein